jgi:hypothetical protein
MIGWVNSLCSDWGAHKRWVYAEVIHPIPCVLGRIIEEGFGASHHRPGQRFQEVFSENSLVVSRAVVGMKPELMAVMVVHYVYTAPLADRPRMVGELNGRPISLRTYWRRIHRAHCYIASRLEMPPAVRAA